MNDGLPSMLAGADQLPLAASETAELASATDGHRAAREVIEGGDATPARLLAFSEAAPQHDHSRSLLRFSYKRKGRRMKRRPPILRRA